MTYSDDFTVSSREKLMELIDQMGFVPFFANEIPGFSLEEHIGEGCWYHDCEEGFWPAWEWKGPVVQEMRCAYGKFLKGKAMYVSAEFFPDFANFRRDGYDLDAAYDDGLVPFGDRELYDLLEENAPILSKELKKLGDYGKRGRKGFDSGIGRLQKRCYVLISDFRYATDRYGQEYGWGVAEYSTPEQFLGKKFKDAVYGCTPEESYARVLKHWRKILPGVSEKLLEKMLRA